MWREWYSIWAESDSKESRGACTWHGGLNCYIQSEWRITSTAFEVTHWSKPKPCLLLCCTCPWSKCFIFDSKSHNNTGEIMYYKAKIKPLLAWGGWVTSGPPSLPQGCVDTVSVPRHQPGKSASGQFLNSKGVGCSVMSGSVWPRKPQPARLLCPWYSPGKNPGVDCHVLLNFKGEEMRSLFTIFSSKRVTAEPRKELSMFLFRFLWLQWASQVALAIKNTPPLQEM